MAVREHTPLRSPVAIRFGRWIDRTETFESLAQRLTPSCGVSRSSPIRAACTVMPTVPPRRVLSTL